MPVYCVAFALSMLLAAAFCRNRKSGSGAISTWIPILPILLVSVFRYGIGTDYFWIYEDGYNAVVQGHSWNYGRFEPGYLAINFIVSYFGGAPFWVFAIMAAIFHYFIYRFILDWSDNVALSLLVLFLGQQWLFSLSGIRQAAAIAIVAYAIKYAQRKEPIRYFILVGLAASIHFTSLVYIPLYWLLTRRFSQVTVLFLSVGLFTITAAFPNIFSSIADLFGRGAYFFSEYNKQRLYITEFAIALLVAIITLAIQCTNQEFDSKYRPIINVAVIGLLAASMSAAIPNAERFDMMFTVVYIVLIPALAKYCKSQLSALSLILLLALTLGTRLVYDTYVNGDSNGIAEYRCILLEDDAIAP